MTPGEFKSLLRTVSVQEIVQQHITTQDPGPHVSSEALRYFETCARTAFQLREDHSVSAIVVGSAKLGFAILDSSDQRQGYRPAYRSYQPGVSDIDVALVSPQLYGKLWQDLALYAANQNNFPWRSDLGHYMLNGWIRPDKFPTNPPQRCSDWKALINQVSTSKHFRYKKLSCGIYYSKNFLDIYQQRGVLAAQTAERVA